MEILKDLNELMASCNYSIYQSYKDIDIYTETESSGSDIPWYHFCGDKNHRDKWEFERSNLK